MFERLFGNTPEEQLRFLQPRVIITGALILIDLIGMIFLGDGASLLIAFAAYVWGWTFLKRWFGWTTIGAFFSRNIVVGVIIFVAYLIIGYIVGIVTFLIGLIRYIQLKVSSR